MEKRTIGAFISALRKAKGMTQAELADSLGISNKAVSRWEREECLPDVSMIPVIAEIFEVTCDELLKGERIIGESGEVSSAKIEKQRKYMLSKCISNFKYMGYISVALALVGFILHLTISYGFFKPIVGFSVLLVLVIGGVTLSVIALAKLNDKLNGNEMFTDIPEQDLNMIGKVKYKTIFISIFFSVFSVIMGMPIFMISRGTIMEEVLSFGDYIKLAPYVVILGMLVWFVFNRILNGKFSGKSRDKKLERCLLWLALWQIGGSSVVCLLCSLPQLFGDNAVVCYILLAIFVPITMIAPIVIIARKNREYSRQVFTTGVLFVGIIVAMVVLMGAFGSYKSYDENGNLTGSGILSDQGAIIGAFVTLIVTFAIYALLKKFWVKK